MIDPEWDHVHRVLDRFEFMKHSRPSESSHEVLTNLRIENRLETSTRGSVLERESKSIPNIEWRTRWCKVVYLLYNWMGIEIRTCMYRSRSDTIRISTVIAGQKKTTTRKVFAWGYPLYFLSSRILNGCNWFHVFERIWRDFTMFLDRELVSKITACNHSYFARE